MSNPPFVVFTDLDGTLLDHESYDWTPALPALSKLRGLGVPIILASSKTAAEIVQIRDALRLGHCPAIVENGAGMLDAEERADADVDTYAALRTALETLPPKLRNHFYGFGDWDEEEVAIQTGLPPEQAKLARWRCYSEPGLFSGNTDERAAFVAALAECGITARRGGRFLTLSFGGTKADRMDEIMARYTDPEGRKPPSVALGDAPNDVEMLEHADIGVVITNPNGAEMPILAGERAGRIHRSTKPGPAGWNEMMLALVSELKDRASGD